MAGGQKVATKIWADETRTQSFTVADGTQISKGILLKLTDPITASKHNGATPATSPPAAGIAAMEKEASDGSTRISVWTDGIFDIFASSAISVGDAIVFVNDGYVSAASTTLVAPASGSVIVGYALETASAGEQINCRIRL